MSYVTNVTASLYGAFMAIPYKWKSYSGHFHLGTLLTSMNIILLAPAAPPVGVKVNSVRFPIYLVHAVFTSDCPYRAAIAGAGCSFKGYVFNNLLCPALLNKSKHLFKHTSFQST